MDLCSVWSSYYYLASTQSQGSLGQPPSHGWLQATIRILHMVFCILCKWTSQWVMSCSCKFGSFLPCVNDIFYAFLFLIFCMIQILNGRESTNAPLPRNHLQTSTCTNMLTSIFHCCFRASAPGHEQLYAFEDMILLCTNIPQIFDFVTIIWELSPLPIWELSPPLGFINLYRCIFRLLLEVHLLIF